MTGGFKFQLSECRVREPRESIGHASALRYLARLTAVAARALRYLALAQSGPLATETSSGTASVATTPIA